MPGRPPYRAPPHCMTLTKPHSALSMFDGISRQGNSRQKVDVELTRLLGLRQKMAAKAADGRILCSSTSREKPSGALKRYYMADTASASESVTSFQYVGS